MEDWDPPIFVYKSDEDKSYVFIKAIDKSDAEDCITKLSNKNYRFRTKMEKWSFVDTTIMSSEEKETLKDTREKIAKWRTYKQAAEDFLRTREELGLNDTLKREVNAIQEFIDCTCNQHLSMDEETLSMERKPFICHNPHNL